MATDSLWQCGRLRKQWSSSTTTQSSNKKNFIRTLISTLDPLLPTVREWATTVVEPDHRMVHNSDFQYTEHEVGGTRPRRDVRSEPLPPKTSSPQAATAKPSQAPPAKPTLEKDTKRSIADHDRQRYHVAQRVASKVKSWEDLIDWLLQGDPVPQDIARAVLKSFNERRVCIQTGDGVYLATCLIERRSTRATFCGLTSWSRPLGQLSQTKLFEQWIQTRFPASRPRAIDEGSNADDTPSCSSSSPLPQDSTLSGPIT